MKEKDAFDEFIGKMFEIEPIDRILLQILRRNPHIKASFNKELGVWFFMAKKEKNSCHPTPAPMKIVNFLFYY